MDWKLELVPIPVSDVDRSKAFYTEKVGFNADIDHRISDELRLVQLTPPGSACSISLGAGTDSEPGTVQGLQVVVDDINAAHEELVGRGVDASEVQEFDVEKGTYRPLAHEPDWNAFVFFKDPDGNGWVLQQRGG